MIKYIEEYANSTLDYFLERSPVGQALLVSVWMTTWIVLLLLIGYFSGFLAFFFFCLSLFFGITFGISKSIEANKAEKKRRGW